MRAWRAAGALVAVLVAAALAAQVAAAAWTTVVSAQSGALSTYTVPAPPNLRCQGLTSLLTSRIAWDPVTGPPGQTVSYRVTRPNGTSETTTDTSFALPIITLLAGPYQVRTLISSGWESAPSTINVALTALGLLYLCGSSS